MSKSKLCIDFYDLPEEFMNGDEVNDNDRVVVDKGQQKEVWVEIEDCFGWDYIVELPNSSFVLTDRNCGMYTYVDRDRFMEWFEDCTKD